MYVYAAIHPMLQVGTAVTGTREGQSRPTQPPPALLLYSDRCFLAAWGAIATGEAASTSTPTHSHTSYAYARRCELQTFTQMALWHWLNDCSFPIKPIKRGDSASINGPEIIDDANLTLSQARFMHWKLNDAQPQGLQSSLLSELIRRPICCSSADKTATGQPVIQRHLYPPDHLI
ncbi:hypothetical protein BDZ45DRAFT_740480 [Acephala macrosclerotiorum]|nr:hypothetical protein BDZ45DRAFT_740480 [Acephala macrosclerotiorum]